MKEPVRILLLCTLPPDLLKTKGGVEQAGLNLLYGFRENAEVRILCISYRKDISQETRIRMSANIEVIQIPHRFRFGLLDYFFNRRALKEAFSAFVPDIIHAQGAGPYLFRLTGIPADRIVITQHGVISEEIKYVRGAARLKFAFKALVERYYFPRFSNFIFISEYNRALLRKRVGQKTALIPNPVHPEFFPEENASERKPNQIAYAGWLSEQKNPILLLEVLGRLKKSGISYRLVIAGEFREEAYRARVIEALRRNDLEEAVEFRGQLERPALCALLRESSIFVNSSLQETLPLSIAEAMACGVTVLAPEICAIPEMVRHGETGYLYHCNDEDALFQLLRSLWNQDETLRRTGRSAAVLAKENYEAKTIASRTLAFYRSILAGG